jgi:hypothetical protein
MGQEIVSMQRRFGIVAVLCFTTTLLVGCTCGLQKPQDRTPGNQAAGAGSGAIVADETDGTALKRAAAFHDSGRYYK